MKKNFRKTLLAVSLSLTVTGCTVYHPQAVDIPLINHPGDVRVDASLGMSLFILPDAINLNATASYGFNEWLAGQVHLNHGGDNYYGQIAPGVYYPLGEKSVLEAYAGIGYGGASRSNISSEYSENTSNNYSFDGRYVLPFLQGNIGWHDLSPLHIDLAFGLKIGGFMPDYHYFEVDDNHLEIPGSAQDYTTPNILLEPQFIIRLGSSSFKVNLKAGFSWLNDINQSANKFIYDFFTFSTGFTFTF